MATTTLAPYQNLNATYTLPAVTNEPEELIRLDQMHIGLRSYFGQELSFAPIGNPKRILEVGAGSGAWAIQAAQMYPQAKITAMDIALPPRALPANVEFKQLNLYNDLPFEPGTFDVIHARFVFCHMTTVPDTLCRLAKLLKPGGWFLTEDMDHMLYGEELTDDTRKLLEVVNDHFRFNGNDSRIGASLERLLNETGLYSQVNATKARLPYNRQANVDLKLKVAGQSIKEFLSRGYRSLTGAQDLTGDIIQAFEKEVDDPNRSYCLDFYAVSAQRS